MNNKKGDKKWSEFVSTLHSDGTMNGDWKVKSGNYTPLHSGSGIPD